MEEEQQHIPRLPAPRKQGVWSKVILIVIAVLVGYFIGRGTIATPSPVDTDDDHAENGEAMMEEKEEENGEAMMEMKKMQGEGSVTVEDQEPGESVVVASATLTGAGWVAIYDERDGTLGNILGAKRLIGDSENITISLLRGTEEGGTYFAVLHGDDGNLEFEFKNGDPQLVDTDGNPIMTEFKTETPGA